MDIIRLLVLLFWPLAVSPDGLRDIRRAPDRFRPTKNIVYINIFIILGKSYHMRMRNPAPLPGGADINRKLLISGHIPVMIVPTNEPQTPRNFVLCTSILIRNTGTLYRSRIIYLFSPKAKYLSTFLKTFFPAVVTTSVMDLDSNWIHIQQLWIRISIRITDLDLHN